MEDVVLKLEPREITGKAVKQLRRNGLVPAVIHDHGKPSVHVSGEYMEVWKAYRKAGKHHPVKVKAGEKNYTALIKSVDLDPRKQSLVHVVFNAIKANEKVTAEIPVHVKLEEGNDITPAERTGLVVLNQLEIVEAEALPKALPDFFEFDGEKLVEVGDSLTVADLLPIEGVTVKTDPTHLLATVFEPSALQAANDAAGGTAEEETAEGETTAEGEETGGETEGSESQDSEEKKEK